MPTYDYVCDACEHEFELFQPISEAKKRKCPECGRLKLRRLFGTGAAVMFKGSGFYETDYRSESYRKAAEKDKKSQEKSSATKDKSSTAKGESKASSGGKNVGSSSNSGSPKGGTAKND